MVEAGAEDAAGIAAKLLTPPARCTNHLVLSARAAGEAVRDMPIDLELLNPHGEPGLRGHQDPDLLGEHRRERDLVAVRSTPAFWKLSASRALPERLTWLAAGTSQPG